MLLSDPSLWQRLSNHSWCPSLKHGHQMRQPTKPHHCTYKLFHWISAMKGIIGSTAWGVAHFKIWMPLLAWDCSANCQSRDGTTSWTAYFFSVIACSTEKLTRAPSKLIIPMTDSSPSVKSLKNCLPSQKSNNTALSSGPSSHNTQHHPWQWCWA